MNVLAVGAHPDDMEILCGGTLARYVRTGHDVTMCHVTNGDKGHATIPGPELARMRNEEAERAAAIIGAAHVSIGCPDMRVLPEDDYTRARLVEVIRRVQPDVIITHCPEDYHTDHRATSKLVFDASFTAGLPAVRTDHPALPKVPPIYYMDTLAGVGFVPTEYVDVSDVMQVKREALLEHKSQKDWLKGFNDIDTIEFIDTVAKYRGLQCGAFFAEGFAACPSWLRLVPRRLLP
jgi:N-acetylglucosamine malate deacetylase 1